MLSPGDTESPNRSRVLVVADEKDNRETLRASLLRSGVEALVADDGPAALQSLDATRPDLILLDVAMSPMSGFDVLRSIRKRFQDTELPVVMVIAESSRKTILQAFREGANDCVSRPLDPELIMARVSQQLRQRRAQAELERSQQLYQMAALGSQVGLWDWDVLHGRLFLSPRWKEMLGYAAHELSDDVETWRNRIHPNDRERFLELFNPLESNQSQRFECEFRLRHRDESYRWMQCAGIVQSDEHGQPRRLAGSLADITEGKIRDVLTGLPNRLLFQERVEAALQRPGLQSDSCAVLFLDLDKVKLVNDSLGREAGDQVLRAVASRLRNCLNPGDLDLPDQGEICIARHGGDEFTALIVGLSSREHATRIASRIIEVISEPYLLGDHEAAISVSIGIAFLHPEQASPADVVCEADIAMSWAKASGRGQFRIFDHEMQEKAAAKLLLESDVRTALREGQFYPVYQPIVSLTSGQIDGFEALCRWRHPRGEAIGPDTFIPILESLGLIGELGRQMLAQAGRQILEWNQQFQRRQLLTLTVNCSTRELARPRFQQELMTKIAELGVDPRMLRLEVTESSLMENPESMGKIVQNLRNASLGVGLDDFGTGYSSLAYLHRLPLDLLKVDRSFISSMLRGDEGVEIVKTIIAMARSLGLDTVAEGVETADQQQLLVQLGCTHGQGFLFSRAVTADAATALLQNDVAGAGANQPPFVLSEQELQDLRQTGCPDPTPASQ